VTVIPVPAIFFSISSADGWIPAFRDGT